MATGRDREGRRASGLEVSHPVLISWRRSWSSRRRDRFLRPGSLPDGASLRTGRTDPVRDRVPPGGPIRGVRPLNYRQLRPGGAVPSIAAPAGPVTGRVEGISRVDQTFGGRTTLSFIVRPTDLAS